MCAFAAQTATSPIQRHVWLKHQNHNDDCDDLWHFVHGPQFVSAIGSRHRTDITANRSYISIIPSFADRLNRLDEARVVRHWLPAAAVKPNAFAKWMAIMQFEWEKYDDKWPRTSWIRYTSGNRYATSPPNHVMAAEKHIILFSHGSQSS